MDAALRHWVTDLGVGPFFVIPNVEIRAHEYRGVPHAAGPRGRVALAQSGGIQIEIIQLLDGHPSLWRDFLERTGGGLHHVSCWLTRRDYQSALERLKHDGIPILQQGVFGPDVRFAYFGSEEPGSGPMCEISEGLEPAIAGFAEMIANASRDWDGSDPIRNVEAA